jgi:hypothetical protein
MGMELTDEQIANLSGEQIEALEKDESKLDEILAAQTANAEPKQAVKDGAANGAGDDEEPVVLTKNGKGVIPYEKHKELRVENAALRQQLEDATKKMDGLLNVKTEAEGDPEATALADADIARHLEVLKQDMPELHQVIQAVLDGSRKQGEKLEKTLAELKGEKEQSERQQQLSVAEQVAEAKDNNPDLVHWETNDPEAWDEALKQDEILRTNAKWINKPYAERFDEVVRRVKAVNADVSTPNSKAATAAKARAEAQAKVAAAPTRKPTTLSDLQGGGNLLSEQEMVANMAPHELLDALMKMPGHKAAALRADLD